MTREEAIADIRDNIKPVVGGKSLDMAIQALTAISELSKSLKAVNRYYMDEKVLIGFNMAVAIFNECFGEIGALKNEQSEQNVGMCQQNVGEMSEKQTDGDLISRDYTIQQIQKAKENNYNFNYNTLLDFINGLPSAEKTAEWIEVIDEIDSYGNKTWHHECSICGSEDSGWGNYKYCPNCGRRMKGVEE